MENLKFQSLVSSYIDGAHAIFCLELFDLYHSETFPRFYEDVFIVTCNSSTKFPARSGT